MPVLHWSPGSPYMRKVMVALHERGLVDQVTTVRTPVDPMIPLVSFMGINPLSKIPTLELGVGQVLFDSHVICRWADHESNHGPTLFPADLTAQRDEALRTGLLDAALPWLVESRLRAPQLRSDDMIAVCRLKMNRVVDWLDARVSSLAQRPFDIGHLSIGVAQCYLDFRFSAEDWRQGRPRLLVVPPESKGLRKQNFLGKMHEGIQMKMTRYTEPQNLAILRQAEGGVPVADLGREHGVSTASFYKWRAKYGGMDASMVSQMKAMDRAIGAPLVQAQWRGRTVG